MNIGWLAANASNSREEDYNLKGFQYWKTSSVGKISKKLVRVFQSISLGDISN